MSALSLGYGPAWAVLPDMLGHFVVGMLLGWLYFRSLWWNANRFSHGGNLATMIALMLGRFALLGGVLALASLEGALPLLVMALGVLVARPMVMRGIRKTAT